MSFWETYVIRNETTVIVEAENYEESPSFQVLRFISAVTSACSLLFGCIAFVIVITRSRKTEHSSAQQYIMKYLYGHLVSMSCSSLSILILTTAKFEPIHWRLCSGLGSLPPTFYMLTHCCNYWIFVQRSKVIRFLSIKWPSTVLSCAKFGTVLICIATLVSPIHTHGKLLPDGTCVQFFPSNLIFMQLVLDCSLGIIFLFLFLIPMYAHLARMQENNVKTVATSRYTNMARVNLLWGSTSILTSFIVVIVSASVQAASGLSTNAQLGRFHFLLFDWAIAPIDMCINLLAALKITQMTWNPSSRLIKTATNDRSPHNLN